MARNKFSAPARPGSLKRVSILAFFCLFFIALAAMLIFYYEKAWEQFVVALEAGKPLFVMDELVTHAIFLTLGLGAGAIFCLLELLVVDFIGQKRKKWLNRAEGLCGGAIVLSVVLVFAGGLFLNPVWHSKLGQAGYERCTNNVFLMSKSFGNSAWVQNGAWCHDKRLAQILRKHHNTAGFDTASRYLEAKYLNNKESTK